MTKIRSQDQLLDAAAKVFSEKGYDAARLEDIAAEVGVLQGSLYYHIESKAGLLRMLRVRRFRDITSRIDAIATSDDAPKEKLRRACLEHLQHTERHLAESPQWFNNPRDPRKTADESAEDRELTARFRDAWRSILEQGVAAGVIRADLDLRLAVLSILGMLNWVTNWYERDGRRSIAEVAEFQFDLIWRAVTSRPVKTPPRPSL